MLTLILCKILREVLIETLWNVNTATIVSNILSLSVLIETLWNVNESGPTLISLSDGRINRNIVECK